MSAFYVKNVPPLERALRLLVGVGGAVVALIVLDAPWSFVAAASAVMMGMTGAIGYCPACALVGRKLDAAGHSPA